MTLATVTPSRMYTKDKIIMISFRLTPFENAKLKKIADRNNISVSLLCRNIITLYLSKEKEDANI